MLLGKLQGYDLVTGQYTDGGGQITNLPKNAFCVEASALPIDYDDISNLPENWDKYGASCIGSVIGFKDWMSLRAIILPLITAICGVDYANFDLLTDEQKIIALKYFPTKIIAAQGFTFFATKSGGESSAYLNIDFYLTESEKARQKRYDNYVNFGYQYLGAIQGLKAESLLRASFLDVTYIKRGVLYVQDDGIDGLGNWTISDNGYTTTGLKARINSGEFVLGGGIPTQTFIDALIGIVANGTY